MLHTMHCTPGEEDRQVGVHGARVDQRVRLCREEFRQKAQVPNRPRFA
jgi:hypothetical protein